LAEGDEDFFALVDEAVGARFLDSEETLLAVELVVDMAEFSSIFLFRIKKSEQCVT
jgi:hypothetical protein